MKPEPDITEQIFPRFRAGTFIEAPHAPSDSGAHSEFPRLRVGTFIEVMQTPIPQAQ